MKKWAFFLLLSLLLTACGSNNEAASGSGHEAHKPTLDVKWDVDGNTLTVKVTTDMSISPEHYGQARKDGEGHIHMYLDDGDKIMITEDQYDFPDLTAGHHTLKVSLHNNDHTPYDVTQSFEFDIE